METKIKADDEERKKNLKKLGVEINEGRLKFTEIRWQLCFEALEHTIFSAFEHAIFSGRERKHVIQDIEGILTRMVDEALNSRDTEWLLMLSFMIGVFTTKLGILAESHEFDDFKKRFRKTNNPVLLSSLNGDMKEDEKETC